MDLVFQAVADATRRGLLARLRDEGALSVTALARPLPMSRQAVSKHLEALGDAGLVDVEWQGRVKLHRLNPEPLLGMSDWLAPYEAAWDRRLARLEKHLKENP